MAKNEKQKLKLYYLVQLFKQYSDDNHGLTMDQILSYLQDKGIKAERKSIYDDIETMNTCMDLEIDKYKQGRQTYYRLISREFDLAEIKLLIDSVHASKFITKNKSDELTDKIRNLVSKYDGDSLNRQIINNDKVKSENKEVLYNVDYIFNAIDSDCMIKFKYYQWNIKKELQVKKDNQYYIVSPWALLWDDQNYYLVAYDNLEKKFKHYRVDKMKHIDLYGKPREGKKEFKNYDMSLYTSINFNMYHGQLETVKVLFDNDMIGVFIDRFGKSIKIKKYDDSHSIAQFQACVSPQFYGWIFALEGKVKVLEPQSVIDGLKDALDKQTKMYKD